MTTRAQAIADAGQAIADGLARQSARSLRDQALAALPRGATETEITAEIQRRREQLLNSA